jgi:hypothetical protein
MRTTFHTRWRNESDAWSTEGSALTAASTLAAIRKALERSAIIVEHGYYRGGSSPTHHVFEDWEEFEAYMDSAAHAGDYVDVWSFGEVCQSDRRIASAKCPADDGMIPKGGSY